MSTEPLIYVTGPLAGTPALNCQIHAFRIGRLELCGAWMRGALPTFFYLRPAGRLRPGCVALTLRIWRLLVGYRWYYSK